MSTTTEELKFSTKEQFGKNWHYPENSPARHLLQVMKRKTLFDEEVSVLKALGLRFCWVANTSKGEE